MNETECCIEIKQKSCGQKKEKLYKVSLYQRKEWSKECKRIVLLNNKGREL